MEKITDKPVYSCNSHGHIDHIGGNGFRDSAYMHKNAPIDFPEPGTALCGPDSLPCPGYKKIFISEGDHFDSGGQNLCIIDISVYSHSSPAILDRKDRMLFTCDELESHQVLLLDLGREETGYRLGRQVEGHRNNMGKLLAYQEEFDFICPGHNGTRLPSPI